MLEEINCIVTLLIQFDEEINHLSANILETAENHANWNLSVNTVTDPPLEL